MRLCLQSQEGGNFERKEGGTQAIKSPGRETLAAAFLKKDIEILLKKTTWRHDIQLPNN